MKILALSTLFLASLSVASAAQLASFQFTGGSLANTASNTGMTVSDVSTDSAFNSFTSETGFDSAAQISGASSFFSAPATQAAAGNALVFTINASPSYTFSITQFSFIARSTDTAPADIGFTINGTAYDFSGFYSNNSTLTTIDMGSLAFTGLTSATISIQGWNASSSGALQLDNLSVVGTAVPEPHEYALGLAGLLVLVVAVRRKRSQS